MSVLPHCACRCTALTNTHTIKLLYITLPSCLFLVSRFSFSFKIYFLYLPHVPCFDFRAIFIHSPSLTQANFLDVGGGASEKQVMDAFTLLDGDRSVKAILGMRARGLPDFCAQIFSIFVRFQNTISMDYCDLLNSYCINSFTHDRSLSFSLVWHFTSYLSFVLFHSLPFLPSIPVNIFGGIMRCDIIALGVLKAVQQIGMKKPIVMRLQGTNVTQARLSLSLARSLALDISQSL